MLDVRADRLRAEDERRRDLLLRLTFSEKAEDLSLARD